MTALVPAASELRARLDGLVRQAAAGSAPATSLHLAPASRALSLHVHGETLARDLARAFGGLGADLPRDAPRATIHAVDLAATGLRLEAPGLPRDGLLRQGEIQPVSSPALRVFWEAEQRALSVWDPAAREGWHVVQDAAALPHYTLAAPMRVLLNLWLSAGGVHMAHGSAVARDGRGMLLAGVGGSGKSTTALLALRAGWEYLSDDWCLVEPGPRPAVHQAYCSCKLRPDAHAWFPDLHHAFANRDRLDAEKATLYLPEAPLGQRLRASAPLAAIALPRVEPGAARTTVEPATAAECWRAIAPPTISCIPGAGGAAALGLGALARQVPAFHLRLGSDHGGVVEALAQLLAPA